MMHRSSAWTGGTVRRRERSSCRRVAFCPAVALLGMGSAAAFLDACGGIDCVETLTCGAPVDASGDTLASNDTGQDRSIDAAVDPDGKVRETGSDPDADAKSNEGGVVGKDGGDAGNPCPECTGCCDEGLNCSEGTSDTACGHEGYCKNCKTGGTTCEHMSCGT